jgi:cellulose synthase/poly-beta-1,6-N-acetylglucosamine synthase-like glycosyltransferase
MHTVVVDDGSTDGMSEIANSFARDRDDITVVTMPDRGGKSSALNAALPFADAEILVCVDSDSHLGENAIWEIVQPFNDPRVGAVSGTVLVRNPFARLVTWLQALEYMRCIFVGRMFTSRLGILGIVSGAFGAYRREAVLQVGAWDVGPGEDGDLCLRVRRAGYEVVFAPYAQCFTTPVSHWKTLIKQRRRWEWAVITLETRKHLDMANPFQASFRIQDLLMLLDRWLYGVVFQYCFLFYVGWLIFHLHDKTLYQFILFYAIYLVFEFVQLLLLLYYSRDRRTVLKLAPVFPLMPFYYLYMRLITLWAISEELIHRRSYKDNFVPEHVRLATWHW